MLLLIDNYDSFTYNLAQYFGELGAEVHVHRNDALTVAEIAAWQPSHLVISPGPCTPSEAGISVAAITRVRRARSRSSACASATRRSGRRSAAASSARSG